MDKRIEDVDFSKLELAVEIVEALNYDDRTSPNWRGHIGHARAEKNFIVASCSYADPREGTNQERLVIRLDNGRVRLYGFDDTGRDFDFTLSLSLEAVLGRVHAAVESGDRAVWQLTEAVRTDAPRRSAEGDELACEF